MRSPGSRLAMDRREASLYEDSLPAYVEPRGMDSIGRPVMRIHIAVVLAGIWLILGIGSATSADETKEAAIKKARKELEGTWQAVSYALDGKKAAAEELKGIQLVFDSDGK